MRQAIGDFLLGLDDLGIYSLKQQLAKAESEFAKIDGQLDSIYRYITPTEGVLREASLKTAIENAGLELNELLAKRDELLIQPDELESNADLNARAVQASSELADIAKELEILTSKRAEILNEAVESEMFIAALDSRMKSLKESRAAYDFFGEVRFKFCPSCLAKLSDAGGEKCHLCKAEMDKASREASYLAALNELAFQKKESTKVLEEMRVRLNEYSNFLSSKQRDLQTAKFNHAMVLRLSSERVIKLNDLSVKIGNVQERISNYNNKIKLVAAVESLIEKKQNLNSSMLELNEKITVSKEKAKSRRESIESRLSEKTVELLKKDGGFEPAFNAAETVMFDFGKDFMLVDGRSKFSASSETVLKNSFHLAILQESLEDKNMRYPRLLLLDNTEDKGMGPDRSQNFQRVLVDLLAQYDEPYQVIMTTSMIDPDLDKSDLCVGPHYVKGMHTLNL
jgi:hypothetical protein